MTITKQDITNHLVDQLGLPQVYCKGLVEVFFDQILVTLSKGEDVKISGFGNFTLREKRARPGRNPKSGEPIPISARRVVTFQASQKLKARCMGISQEEKE